MQTGFVVFIEPLWFYPGFRRYSAVLSIKKMYCYIEPVLSLFPEKIQADNYMCMYSRGSLENNRKVKWLLDYAQQQGHLRPDNILIENVSGPVIDKEKSEFIIKIMIPLGLKK